MGERRGRELVITMLASEALCIPGGPPPAVTGIEGERAAAAADENVVGPVPLAEGGDCDRGTPVLAAAVVVVVAVEAVAPPLPLPPTPPKAPRMADAKEGPVTLDTGGEATEGARTGEACAGGRTTGILMAGEATLPVVTIVVAAVPVATVRAVFVVDSPLPFPVFVALVTGGDEAVILDFLLGVT